MAQDAPKRRFLSLIFLVSCITKLMVMVIVTDDKHFSSDNFRGKSVHGHRASNRGNFVLLDRIHAYITL